AHPTAAFRPHAPRPRRAVPSARGERHRLRHHHAEPRGARGDVDGGSGADVRVPRGRGAGQPLLHLLSAGRRRVGHAGARPEPGGRGRALRDGRLADAAGRLAPVGERGDHGRPRPVGAADRVRTDHPRPHRAQGSGDPVRRKPPALPFALRQQPRRHLLVRPGRHPAHRQPRGRGADRLRDRRPAHALVLVADGARRPRPDARALRIGGAGRALPRADGAGAPGGQAGGPAGDAGAHHRAGAEHRRVLHHRGRHRAPARRGRARVASAARAHRPRRGRGGQPGQDALSGRGDARAEDAAARHHGIHGAAARRGGRLQRHAAAPPGAHPQQRPPAAADDRGRAGLRASGRGGRRGEAGPGEAGRGGGRGGGRNPADGQAEGADDRDPRGRGLHCRNRQAARARTAARAAFQRGEVHGGGAGGRNAQPRHLVGGGGGVGHGDRAGHGPDRDDLGALLAGRQPHDPPRGRQRAGVEHCAAAGDAAGGRPAGGQHPRPGQQLHPAPSHRPRL
ncbi:MAG: diguanylate cyclase/phosphodiesterase (GGDEF & EAL domains) with PAS/PAC sensor(s), partial [uncultured Gemmatimonadetes bacterium]